MRLGSVVVLPALVLLATSGHAQVPYYYVTGPRFIDLVGSSVGVPDPRGSGTFLVRDIGHQPVPYARVDIDFTDCHDLAICQDQADPALTFTCYPVLELATKYTDANGFVTFDLVGYATAPGGSGGPGLASAWIRVNGYRAADAGLTFTACDRTGGDGVNIGDLPAILQDWGSGTYVGRSDFNHSGTLSIMDVAYWLRLWGGGGSVDGCAAGVACP